MVLCAQNRSILCADHRMFRLVSYWLWKYETIKIQKVFTDINTNLLSFIKETMGHIWTSQKMIKNLCTVQEQAFHVSYKLAHRISKRLTQLHRSLLYSLMLTWSERSPVQICHKSVEKLVPNLQWHHMEENTKQVQGHKAVERNTH